jgi:hypothetical protein
LIKGKGNLDRFDYWLNSFKYLKATGKLACTLGEYNIKLKAVKEIKERETQKSAAVDQLLPLRKQIVNEMEIAYNYQVSTITSQGALGNLCNWQQHISDLMIEKPGAETDCSDGKNKPQQRRRPQDESYLCRIAAGRDSY